MTLDFDNLNNSTINTIIGGGADNSASTVDALDVSFSTYTMGTYSSYFQLFATPDGKIYFNDRSWSGSSLMGATSWKIRVYDESSNPQVTSIIPNGTGYPTNAAQDIGVCKARTFGGSFSPPSSALTNLIINMRSTSGQCSADRHVKIDPATGAGTGLSTGHPAESGSTSYLLFPKVGMDGNLYAVSRYNALLKKYNAGTGLYETILGNGVTGTCPDNTVATSCKIDLQDAFIDASGRVYFVDQGKVRLIDDNNKVQTVFGQSFDYGDGGNALSARFHTIENMRVANNGEVILLDRATFKFRSFLPGGNINTLAGSGYDGTPSTGVDATTMPLRISGAGIYWNDFAIDPSNGDIFYNRGADRIAKLNRSTGFWEDEFGATNGTDYWLNDGNSGSGADLGSYYPRVVGFNGTNIVIGHSDYDGVIKNGQFKLYDVTNSYNQSHLVGDSTSGGSFCANGVALNICNSPEPRAYPTGKVDFDSNTSRWLMHIMNTTSVKALAPGGNMATLTTLTESAYGFDHYWDGADDIIYYCSQATGKLCKHIVGGTDTELIWPIVSMSCAGRDIYYDSGNDELIFIYTQNNLMGVAKYKNP